VSNGEFWALRDVSFEVKAGEVVGIVGRNGAGKSTLLKILARITEPTSGRFGLRGRVGSLLEVGTGFHPELTGRENIFLNGAVLGMTQWEIRQKFDEIVAFAEVEDFLDTRVKYYSSGMHVRLGFSVAAHLDPEILIVDEVLAVGDGAFQKKCLGKMENVTESGRTVLFVSHNMAAINSLCHRAILISQGSITAIGATRDITTAYLRECAPAEMVTSIQDQIASLPQDSVFRLQSVSVRQNGVETLEVGNGTSIEVGIDYEIAERTMGLRVYVDLFDDMGNLLVRTFHDEDCDAMESVVPGIYQSVVTIPADFLAPRDYTLHIQATIHNKRYCTGDRGVPVRLRVYPTTRLNRAYPQQRICGHLQPSIPWRTTYVAKAS
jgi:lipopolysaccharide transport system ATP-binding protein